MIADPAVQKRVEVLFREATQMLDAIRSLSSASSVDPLTDPATLTRAVTSGILDAPQLLNNKFGRGLVKTRIVNGASLSVDNESRVIPEDKRIKNLLMMEVQK